MEFTNINLWFAKDKNNSIITIDKINEENKHNIYTCPICGSELIARTGEIKIHHFAHKDKSKCSSETMIHWWVKHKLIDIGDKFSIKIDKDNIKEFICKEIYVEKEYNTDFGTYKPDITIITDTDEVIYFEIEYTNKKKVEEYLDRWLCLDNIVVEVSVKDLINNNVVELKTIFYKGKCYNINTFEAKYNNSIGQYKQKIFNSEEVDKAKQRLNKINWFWEECKKYRMRKTDEYTFFDVIDCLDIRDKEYVIDGLLKSNCTDVRRLYLYNKQKETKKFIKKFCSDNNISLNIGYYDEIRYSEMFEKGFRVPLINIEDFNKKYYCDILDKDDLIRRLYNYLISTKDYDYIINAIEKINNIIDDNYTLKGSVRNNYNCLSLSVEYKDNIIIEFEISDIKNSNIKEIVINKISEYESNLKLCGFENSILNYLKEKKESFRNLKPIRGFDMIMFVKENRQDNIKLYIEKHGYFYNTDYHLLTIEGNNICNESSKITEFSTFEDFKVKIDKALSSAIRNIRYDLKED